jgi:hypothetical protein
VRGSEGAAARGARPGLTRFNSSENLYLARLLLPVMLLFSLFLDLIQSE